MRRYWRFDWRYWYQWSRLSKRHKRVSTCTRAFLSSKAAYRISKHMYYTCFHIYFFVTCYLSAELQAKICAAFFHVWCMRAEFSKYCNITTKNEHSNMQQNQSSAFYISQMLVLNAYAFIMIHEEKNIKI